MYLSPENPSKICIHQREMVLIEKAVRDEPFSGLIFPVLANSEKGTVAVLGPFAKSFSGRTEIVGCRHAACLGVCVCVSVCVSCGYTCGCECARVCARVCAHKHVFSSLCVKVL